MYRPFHLPPPPAAPSNEWRVTYAFAFSGEKAVNVRNAQLHLITMYGIECILCIT